MDCGESSLEKQSQDQYQETVRALRQRFVMFRKPCWVPSQLLLPTVMAACALSAILASGTIEINSLKDESRVSGHSPLQGLTFHFDMPYVYGALIVTAILFYGQSRMDNEGTYLAVPWLIWMSYEGLLTETPTVISVCKDVFMLSPLQGVIMLAVCSLLVYAQYALTISIYHNCGPAVSHVTHYKKHLENILNPTAPEPCPVS